MSVVAEKGHSSYGMLIDCVVCETCMNLHLYPKAICSTKNTFTHIVNQIVGPITMN